MGGGGGGAMGGGGGGAMGVGVIWGPMLADAGRRHDAVERAARRGSAGAVDDELAEVKPGGALGLAIALAAKPRASAESSPSGTPCMSYVRGGWV